MSGQLTLKVFEPKESWHKGFNYRHPLHRVDPAAPLTLLIDERPATTVGHGQTITLPASEGSHTARLVPNARMFRWLYSSGETRTGPLIAPVQSALRLMARSWPSVRFNIAGSEHVVLRTKALKLAVEKPSTSVLDADIQVTDQLPPPSVAAVSASSSQPTVEFREGIRTVVRQEETIRVDAGAVITVRRVDHVDRTVTLVGATTEASAGLTLGVVEASLRRRVGTEPNTQCRSALTRDVEIRLNGDVTTAWSIGFEDHWAQAVFRDGALSAPFEYLARTHTFARAIPAANTD